VLGVVQDVHEKAMERLQAQQELAAEAHTKEALMIHIYGQHQRGSAQPPTHPRGGEPPGLVIGACELLFDPLSLAVEGAHRPG
jgi:hypothetical protein